MTDMTDRQTDRQRMSAAGSRVYDIVSHYLPDPELNRVYLLVMTLNCMLPSLITSMCCVQNC